MADPRLKRKFTTRDAYNLVMRQTQEAREDARAWKVALGLADLMGGSNYRGSSAQARNNAMGERAQKLVSGSSSGAASRHKMLIDADKEELVAMFNEKFNKELPGFKSIMDFNSWVNKVDVEGWYPSELRSKHSTIVRNALTGRKQKILSDKSSEFLDENLPLWLSNDYTQQQLFREILAEKIKGDAYGTLWGAEVMDQASKILSAQGQYTERDQTLQEESAQRDIDAAALTQEKWDVQKDVATQKTATEGISRAGAYRLFEYMKKPEDAPGIGEGLDFDEARAKVVKEMQGTNWDIKVFEDVVKSLREDKAPGTKPVYDPATDSTIFATDAEIAADNSLVPTAAESNLDPIHAHIGAFMAINGEIPNEIWKKYYKGGMDLLYNSLGGVDREHLKKWLKKVDEYKAKAATPFSINYELLNPDKTGQATGQTDDGISNVRIKK